MNRYAISILICFIVKASMAVNYYVSTSGSDSNTGTTPGAPLLTLDKALTKVAAGDTIWMREGTYFHSVTITISKSGTASNKYYLKAMPGEKPVLDFSGTASGKRGISLTGSYWVIKGITFTLAGDNGMIISGGAFNLIENCAFVENEDTGLQLGAGAHDNRIINCDSYYNADPPDFGDADGFSPKMDVGSNNYFYGCRAWLNCDDGWDGYLRGADKVTTILENCWTWRNGYFKDGTDAGPNANGNGFKMGGSDDKTLQHNFLVKNCLAFENKAKGFDQNNNKGSMTIYNGTGLRNKGNDFSIPSPLAAGQTATVKNCLLADGKISLGSFVIQESNSWNGSFTVNAEDFLSLNTIGVDGPRKADGSLPDLSFVHLAAGSDLINTGVDVGLPYKGTKPDLGCFETDVPVEAILLQEKKPGHFNIRIIPDDKQVEISFDTAGGTRFSGQLWSLNGSEIWNSQTKTQGSSPGSFRINYNGFTPGIYLFRFTAGDKVQSWKFRLP
jgi:hypothetical protein